jgi:hypothetical protein
MVSPRARGRGGGYAAFHDEQAAVRAATYGPLTFRASCSQREERNHEAIASQVGNAAGCN